MISTDYWRSCQKNRELWFILDSLGKIWRVEFIDGTDLLGVCPLFDFLTIGVDGFSPPV